MGGQTCTPRPLRPRPPPHRLRCAVCHIESGTRVVPFQTRRETGITLRKVGRDSDGNPVYRCQFCYVGPEPQEVSP